MTVARVSAAALLACLALGSAASAVEVDLSSPKASVRTFYAAILESDDAAIRAAVVEEPGHQEAALALARFSRSIVAIEKASQERFQTSLRTDGNPKVTLSIPDINAVNYAKVEGDDQFATVTVEGMSDPLRVKRVGGDWRVDMTDAKVRNEQDLRQAAETMGRLTTPMAEFADAITQGKFESVHAARMAFLGVMFRGVMGAATQPGSETKTTVTTTQPAN